MDQTAILLAILFIPLASAGLITLFCLKRGTLAMILSVGAALLIAVCSIVLVYYHAGTVVHPQLEWFKLGNLTVKMGFLFDKYAAIMLLVVAFVGFWIHLFSAGYMRADKSKGRYFAGLSIFMFSMLGIVLSDNLIMLFIFWELVGFSSYALIAHYKDTQEATDASKKAFIVNRIGDFGFLIGIIWSFWRFGTVDLTELSSVVSISPPLLSSALAFLLICGFIGKSAQFPLQVWLPDAMAGPTPVSALIHAATMVAAGIYLLVRINFLITPEVLTLILWLGIAMAAYAGLCALGQKDIKKILAYSTLSQLGYMAAAVGLGYPGLALFHLSTHAAFKALLFLGAGSVIDSLHHEQDIYKMGGVLKRMPITGITFAIGLLALCGVTYTSGFFSKDAIIEAAYSVDKTAFGLLLFSAFLTSVYMGRLFWVAFLGEGKTKYAKEARESSWVMTLPLIVLAICSLIAGYVTLWPESLSAVFSGELLNVHHFVEEHGLATIMLVAGTAAWVLGLTLSYLIYGRNTERDTLEANAPKLFYLFKSKLWFDEIYNFYVKQIQQRFADLLGFIDHVILSGLIVRGGAGMFGLVGLVTRALHVGSLHVYVYWFLLGLLLFGAFAFGWI